MWRVSHQKKFMSPLYRLFLNVLITEKSKCLRIENSFLACCLYVIFSSFSVLHRFVVSFRRFSGKITWQIKAINSKFSLDFIKKIKREQNTQIFVSCITSLSFFDSSNFLECFRLKNVSCSF